jgi:hypothetical protein
MSYHDAIKEAVHMPQFDYIEVDRIYESMSFFQRPMGMPKADGTVKTVMDTSMHLAGQFPTGTGFMVTGVRVLFVPDWPAHRGNMENDEHDARAMLLGGEFMLRIQNREYLRLAPLALLPPCVPKTWAGELRPVEGDPDAEAQWRAVYDQDPSTRAVYAYMGIVPLWIMENQFFEARITATPGPLRSPGRLGVILDGRLMRSS